YLPVSVYGTSTGQQTTTGFLAARLPTLSVCPWAPRTVGVQPYARRICLPRGLRPSTPKFVSVRECHFCLTPSFIAGRAVPEYLTGFPSGSPFGYPLGLD